MLSMPRIVRPDPHRIRRTEFGSPVGPATRRSIKRNKEPPKHLINSIRSQTKRRPEKELASEQARNGDSPPLSNGAVD
ncbi:MAG: hypothetical protein DME36_08325 [Verrucomicrobia bacterium]|nr:MAG: hypothetical protein DME36_08325 [Verrucomicrobiota bacterium]